MQDASKRSDQYGIQKLRYHLTSSLRHTERDFERFKTKQTFDEVSVGGHQNWLTTNFSESMNFVKRDFLKFATKLRI